jgi:hypothetical protein
MLEKLVIRGFQVHRKRTIDFGPLVTTIIGTTDAGKSSIVRILRWICLNAQFESEIINWDASKAVGKLYVDGHKIVRERSSSLNRYALDDKEFRAFGTSVPDDIAELLRMSKENFQGQITLPFWISDAPGQVSRELNRIVNLSVIDRTLANVASRLRTSRATEEVSRERLKKASKDMKSLRWVPKMEKQLRVLETAEQAFLTKREKARKLVVLLAQVDEINEVQEETDRELYLVRGLLAVGKEARSLLSKVKALEKLHNDGTRAETLVGREIPSFKPLDQASAKHTRLNTQVETLSNYVRSMDLLERTIESDETELSEIRQELESFKGEECPLCQQKIK